MILATDLDGTFLGGKSLQKQQLYRILRENTAVRLIYVTGRGLESVIPILNDPIIPNPDYIICDVGATIVNGHTLEPVEHLQSEIEKKWPGRLQIENAVKDLEGLVFQEVPQQRRCSLYTDDNTVVEKVKRKMEVYDLDVIYSADHFLDILPGGVNKGSSLIRLVDFIGGDRADVLVAGDTLNDLAMYQCGLKGVVVGNAERALVEAIASIDDLYVASAPGCGGILEAIEFFPRFQAEFSLPAETFKYRENADIPQLVMMYHRFPYESVLFNGKMERVTPKSPNGILPTLQSFFAHGRSGVWIAWEEVTQEGEQLRNIYIDKEKYPNLMASRIGLTKKEVGIFYKSFAKEAFWPTIFTFVDKVNFNHQHWDHFVTINKRFATKAAEQADYGASVWIHDYNLWMVPGLLRQFRPDLTIAFFHHTAFPAANTFNILPWRREIIGSLLQCDFIGFHIPRYAENFVDVAASLFPIEPHKKVNCAPKFLTYSTAIGVNQMTPAIDIDQRTVRLGAVPVGIDSDYIRELFKDGTMAERVGEMKQQLGDKKMILSAERLDYVKGPLEKMLAFEQFLEDYPEFHGKVELVNICTPPAEGMKIYDGIKRSLEQAAGRINGKYASINWTPVRLFFRALPFEEILVYYGAADIAWITPLRDGLNLVAKEYIAVQGLLPGEKGVLILSEFAGASAELSYVVLTNPYDPKSLRESLLQSMVMNAGEKKMRMDRLFEHVMHYNIDYWAEDFIRQAFPDRNFSVPSVALQFNGESTKKNSYGVPG